MSCDHELANEWVRKAFLLVDVVWLFKITKIVGYPELTFKNTAGQGWWWCGGGGGGGGSSLIWAIKV